MSRSSREPEGGLMNVLSLPPRCLQMYAEFITKNASSVAQIESALRSLTYILPGRQRESDIASESLHSVIQLVSLYHTSLLTRSFTQTRSPLSASASSSPSFSSSSTPFHPAPHTRYTSYWAKNSNLYKRASVLLQTIRYVELLFEMTAKRRSETVRWRVVVFMEMLKAVCRLALLRVTGQRPLVTPPLPERPSISSDDEDDCSTHERATEDVPLRHVDPTPAEGGYHEAEQLLPSSQPMSPSPWRMPRTGLCLPSLPDPQDITSYLLSRVLTADDIKPPLQLLRRLSTSQGQVAEVLFILRPVIYALALQRFSSVLGSTSGNKRNSLNSWIPWLLGISLEIGSRRLAERDLRERSAGGWRGLTGLEREEMSKRGWGLGWWTLRGGFYQGITRPALRGVINRLKGKPVLDLVGGVLEDYENLWDGYYFATSNM